MPNEAPINISPSKPIKGKELPVFGSLERRAGAAPLLVPAPAREPRPEPAQQSGLADLELAVEAEASVQLGFFCCVTMCFRNFNDLGRRYRHSLFQTEGVRHLAVDIKLLTFGNLEFLVCVVFHRQDYGTRRIDVPNLAGDGLCGRGQLGLVVVMVVRWIVIPGFRS